MSCTLNHYDDQIGCCRAAPPVFQIKLDFHAKLCASCSATATISVAILQVSSIAQSYLSNGNDIMIQGKMAICLPSFDLALNTPPRS